MSNPDWTDDDYRTLARQFFQDDGEVEVDDGATVSRNDDPSCSHGAYVAAWVWVDSPTGEDS